ncbi:MAG: ParB N-terminal domain-containing protein [Candidatus Hydrothermales bacterium]
MENLRDEIRELIEEIENDGVKILSVFNDPYGGKIQFLVEIPLSLVEPTPFQRDLSEPHVRRLMEVIETVGRYLDPIILVRPRKSVYWTPNGNHRREAMLRLGKEKIVGILIPDYSTTYQILALNTEKAHNIKEKSLEVIRMYKTLMIEERERYESEFSFQFEEAPFVTLGLLYESKPKFSGGAYHSFLKKIDNFLDLPFEEAFLEREKRAAFLSEVDEIVQDKVTKIKERGINHPFVKQFVVSKANPFGKRRKLDLNYFEALEMFKERLLEIDVSKVKYEDIVSVDGMYED